MVGRAIEGEPTDLPGFTGGTGRESRKASSVGPSTVARVSPSSEARSIIAPSSLDGLLESGAAPARIRTGRGGAPGPREQPVPSDWLPSLGIGCGKSLNIDGRP
eukprot:scaffold30948_cov112-Isochrysis_galbana.AAC.4